MSHPVFAPRFTTQQMALVDELLEEAVDELTDELDAMASNGYPYQDETARTLRMARLTARNARQRLVEAGWQGAA